VTESIPIQYFIVQSVDGQPLHENHVRKYFASFGILKWIQVCVLPRINSHSMVQVPDPTQMAFAFEETKVSNYVSMYGHRVNGKDVRLIPSGGEWGFLHDGTVPKQRGQRKEGESECVTLD
jgi:hypothetical protein